MIRTTLFALLVGSAILFPLSRWQNPPTVVFVAGVYINVLIWWFAALEPWFARLRTRQEGPPLQSRFYLGIIALGALLVGTLLFIKFSETPPLQEPLVGHTQHINALILSPNADKIASAGDDRVLRLWKFDPGNKKFVSEREFPAPNQTSYTIYNEQFTSVASSPDGSYVAFGSKTGTIRVWDWRDKVIVRQLTGHVGAVRLLAFSPDSKWLVSGGGDDKTVRLWRVSDWATIRHPIQHDDRVTSLAFSPDSQWLATGSADKTIRLWNINDATARKLEGHSESIIALGFARENNEWILLSVSDRRTLRRWKVADGSLIQEQYRDKQDSITSAVFNLDGTFFATGDSDKVIRLWWATLVLPPTPLPYRFGASPTATPSRPFRAEFKGHEDVVTCLEFDPSSNRLVSGSKDMTLRVWEILKPNGGSPKPSAGHIGEVTDVAFSPDGTSFASASEDKTVRVWNATNGMQSAVFDGTSEGITHLAFSAGQTYLVSISRDGYIRAWQAADGTLKYELNGKPYRLTALAAHPIDSNAIATGNLAGQVNLWKLNDGSSILIMVPGYGVTRLAYSPNGKIIATSSADNKIRLWNAGDGKPVNKDAPLAHKENITALTFSPDGKTLVSTGMDQQVFLWQFQDQTAMTMTQQIKLPNVSRNISAMAFDREGKTLAAIDGQNTVRVWNVADTTLLTDLAVPTPSVAAIGINDDGKIITASTDNVGRAIQVWASPNRLAEMGDRYGQYSITYFLIGSELARIFWAVVLGLLSVTGFVLLVAVASAAKTARTIFSRYPGYDFRQAWRATINAQWGIQRIQQIVSSGEIKTVSPSASALSVFGGPGVLIVEEGHAAVLMRSGRFSRVVGNGITWLTPFERVHMPIYLAPRSESIQVKDVVTLDKVALATFSVLVFHKVDPGKRTDASGEYQYDPQLIKEKIWSPKGDDWRSAVSSITGSVVRDVIAHYNLEDIVPISDDARQQVTNELVAGINSKTQRLLGVIIVALDIREITLSQEVQAALEEKSLAEVRRQTIMINAEAEKEKKVREAEGAALTLRRLEEEQAGIRKELLQQFMMPLQQAPALVSQDSTLAELYVAGTQKLIEQIRTMTGRDDPDISQYADILDRRTTKERERTFLLENAKQLDAMGFDVFLCHNSADKSEVKRIGKLLKARRIRPWLDEWELRPGMPWPRTLERQIKQIRSAAVFVGENGVGPWQDFEIEAFLRQFVKRGCPIIPIVLPGCKNIPELPVFLESMTWVDFRKQEPDPLEQLIWGITGEHRTP